MAAVATSALPTTNTVTANDRVVVLYDPDGTPSLRTIGFANLQASMTFGNSTVAGTLKPGSTITVSNGVFDYVIDTTLRDLPVNIDDGGNTVDTIDSTYRGKFVYMSGSNGQSTYTIPAHATDALAVGFQCVFVYDGFSNTFIIKSETGNAVTISAVNKAASGNVHSWTCGGGANTSLYVLVKTRTDRWLLDGPDLVAT